MSEGVPYADIVILALIAGFILLRLRSVLGQKNSNEADTYKKEAPQSALRIASPIVLLDEKSLKAKPREPDPYLAAIGDTALLKTLNDIKDKDLQFTATSFLNGAKMAYEMTFDAFAKSDRQTLAMLLAEKPLAHFTDAINERAKQANRSESTLVSVAAKDITQASLDKNMARLTVKFASEQVTVVRDGEGKIVEGDPSDIHHIENQWVFERDITSKNPNWKIIET
jgi:predicted lipid-binding transport protein (Tim44 family)